ncbi:MAG TPA: hypothetical protein VGS22_25315 [Thermoanaerobaculia bacterium]|nr:hypothetical protein [Thermoanaerobaculia bacterium]
MLIDQALARAAGGPATGRLLNNKAFGLEQAGDSAAAVAVLREALPLVDAQGEERHRFSVRFNLAVNLLALDRVAEAAVLVPAVRGLALAQRLEFDLLRVNWLEGRLAAGEGRRNEAIAQIAEAADRFAERNMPYDAALAALDLAALLLEAGRAAEAEARVAHAMPIFLAWGIDREALASLRLFLDALKQQRATAALARAAAVAWRHFGGVPPRKRMR